MLELVDQGLRFDIVDISLNGQLLFLDEEVGHIKIVLRVARELRVAEETVVDVQGLEDVESLLWEVDDGVVIEALAWVLGQVDDVLVLPLEGVVS